MKTWAAADFVKSSLQIKKAKRRILFVWILQQQNKWSDQIKTHEDTQPLWTKHHREKCLFNFICCFLLFMWVFYLTTVTSFLLIQTRQHVGVKLNCVDGFKSWNTNNNNNKNTQWSRISCFSWVWRHFPLKTWILVQLNLNSTCFTSAVILIKHSCSFNSHVVWTFKHTREV